MDQQIRAHETPELSPESGRALRFLRVWAEGRPAPFSLDVIEPLFSTSGATALEGVADQLCYFRYLRRVGPLHYEIGSRGATGSRSRPSDPTRTARAIWD